MQKRDETYNVLENISLMLRDKFTPRQHTSQRHREIRNPCERGKLLNYRQHWNVSVPPFYLITKMQSTTEHGLYWIQERLLISNKKSVFILFLYLYTLRNRKQFI
jgi:hypothetical protein